MIRVFVPWLRLAVACNGKAQTDSQQEDGSQHVPIVAKLGRRASESNFISSLSSSAEHLLRPGEADQVEGSLPRNTQHLLTKGSFDFASRFARGNRRLRSERKQAAPRGKWSSLGQANPPKEEPYIRWRSWCWRCRLGGGRTIDRIGHQADIHAAVLGSTITGLVRIHRLVLAQTDQIDLVGRDAVLRSQVLNHGISTTLAKTVVVVRVAVESVPPSTAMM